MADASTLPWWQTLGDTVGLPGLAAGGYSGAKALGAAGRFGIKAAGSLASRPLPALSAMMYGLGDGKGNATTELNSGEQPLYIRDPASGQMIPNPNNPLANKQAVDPSAPPQAAAGAPATALASPSAPAGASGAPSPDAASPQAPQFPGGVPLPPQRPSMPPQFAGGSPPMPQPRPGAAPWNNPDTGMPMPQGGGSAMPSFYNGPGSMNFGQGGAQGGGGSGAQGLLSFLSGSVGPKQAFSLSNFLQGGQKAEDALGSAPDKPFWNAARSLTGTKNYADYPAPAYGWRPSNDWFNN